MSDNRLSIYADESTAKGQYRHFLGGVALLSSDVSEIEAHLRESACNAGFSSKEIHWSKLKKLQNLLNMPANDRISHAKSNHLVRYEQI
jgi:hypothetical protein